METREGWHGNKRGGGMATEEGWQLVCARELQV